MSKKARGAGRRKARRLDFTDRIIIEACILDHRTLGQIASRPRVHKSTVLREIARGSTIVGGTKIPCPGKWLGTRDRCRKKAHCGLERAFYRGKDAQLLSDVRRARRPSTRLSPEALAMVEEAVSEGVRLGQSIHHVYASTPALRGICCERTVRRLACAGLLSAKPHELRRYVRFSHRLPSDSRPRGQGVADIRVLIGRTHRDFLERRAARPRECLVQPGSVVGRASDRRALLTITFPKYGFQFGRIIEKGRPGDVVRALKGVFRRLPPELAREAFQVLLCDNGTEFSACPTSRRARAGRGSAPSSTPPRTGPPTRRSARGTTSSCATASPRGARSTPSPRSRSTRCTPTSTPTSGGARATGPPTSSSSGGSARPSWTP